jgi:hypothetical protein
MSRHEKERLADIGFGFELEQPLSEGRTACLAKLPFEEFDCIFGFVAGMMLADPTVLPINHESHFLFPGVHRQRRFHRRLFSVRRVTDCLQYSYPPAEGVSFAISISDGIARIT